MRGYGTGVIPKKKANDLGIIVSVWLDPSIVAAAYESHPGARTRFQRLDGYDDPTGGVLLPSNLESPWAGVSLPFPPEDSLP
jgi:hypothetical protein